MKNSHLPPLPVDLITTSRRFFDAFDGVDLTDRYETQRAMYPLIAHIYECLGHPVDTDFAIALPQATIDAITKRAQLLESQIAHELRYHPGSTRAQICAEIFDHPRFAPWFLISEGA